MSLPRNKTDLLRRWDKGEHFEFFLFYGHKPPARGVDASCLSQWFQSDFVIDGVEYATAEHWMMAEKARLFDDPVMLEAILDAPGPREAKAFGRQVRDFDQQAWEEHRFEIVRRGNFSKFSQDDDLKEFLLSTAYQSAMPLGKVAEPKSNYAVSKDPEEIENEDSNVSIPFPTEKSDQTSDSKVILVEAAGRDTIWGIGLGVNNPRSLDPTQWRGKNLLGFVLTAVRQELAAKQNS